ncbi:MAG: pyridoxamine 5'-phosphate oxidase family protein [Eubacteriales bacterium]|nr:pyridoxamine 5'-phosphate oxidase family protein [Eubacteriales bacterium]
MRKSNREITDRAELRAILDACDVCRVAFSDQGQPYIVPMNFGFRWVESELTLFFHCALEGRKLNIIHENNRVCFEMDHRHELVVGERACDYSMKYESLIGNGVIDLITDPDEKIDGLTVLMHQYSSRTDWTFDEKVLARTHVLRIRVSDFTAKRLSKKSASN